MHEDGGRATADGDNKALYRRFIQEVVNQGVLAAVDELMAPDLVEDEELPPGLPANAEGVK